MESSAGRNSESGSDEEADELIEILATGSVETIIASVKDYAARKIPQTSPSLGSETVEAVAGVKDHKLTDDDNNQMIRAIASKAGMSAGDPDYINFKNCFIAMFKGIREDNENIEELVQHYTAARDRISPDNLIAVLATGDKENILGAIRRLARQNDQQSLSSPGVEAVAGVKDHKLTDDENDQMIRVIASKAGISHESTVYQQFKEKFYSMFKGINDESIEQLVDDYISAREKRVEKTEMTMLEKSREKFIKNIAQLASQHETVQREKMAEEILNHILTSDSSLPFMEADAIVKQHAQPSSTTFTYLQSDEELKAFIRGLIILIRTKEQEGYSKVDLQRLILDHVHLYHSKKIDFTMLLTMHDGNKEAYEAGRQQSMNEQASQLRKQSKEIGGLKSDFAGLKKNETSLREELEAKGKLLAEQVKKNKRQSDMLQGQQHLNEEQRKKIQEQAETIQVNIKILEKLKSEIAALKDQLASKAPESTPKQSLRREETVSPPVEDQKIQELRKKLEKAELQLKELQEDKNQQARLIATLQSTRSNPESGTRAALPQSMSLAAQLKDKEPDDDEPVAIVQAETLPTVYSLDTLLVCLDQLELELRGKVDSTSKLEQLVRLRASILELRAEPQETEDQFSKVTRETIVLIQSVSPGMLKLSSDVKPESASFAQLLSLVHQASIAIQQRQPAPVQPVVTQEMMDLAACIDKIILPTLMSRTGYGDDITTKEQRKAIKKFERIYDTLKQGNLDGSEQAAVKNYVRVFLREFCLSIVNDLAQNKLSKTIQDRMAAHYNALVAEAKEPTTANLLSIATSLSRDVESLKVLELAAKKNHNITDNDISKILAAVQVEGTRDDGWKVDKKRLKLTDTEFTVPMMLEKPGGRLFWSNKQSVEITFAKQPDGSFQVKPSSTKVDVGYLVGRLAKDIANPKHTREMIDSSNKVQKK